MGSRLGVEKSAAKKTGGTLRTWRNKRAAGFLWCHACRLWHPRTNFVADKYRNTGKAALCRQCASKVSAASRYKTTVKELGAMRKKQKGRCLICRREQKLEIDHNHNSGKIRGFLCSRCNGALGQFCDNIGLLKKAIRYLEKTNG